MSLHNSKMKSEYWSYIWLVIGFIFLIFSNGFWNIIPIAAWLAPIFLLRFLRTQNKTKGLVIFAPVYVIAWIIMLYGMFLGIIGYIFAVTYGIIFFIPFLADRFITPKIEGYLSTLVFPSAWVTMELIASFTLFGSLFSLAYTQFGNLPLMQLVSITGIWGISFLIIWFASVVNWAWEQEFSLPKIYKGASLYLGILIFILLFGGAYLTFLPVDSDTVRVASVTRSFDIFPLAKECNKNISCIQGVLNQSLDDFLEHSKQAADAGAKIIVWQEAGIFVFNDDEAGYIRQAREFAMREKVYLVMGIMAISEDESINENKVVLIDPSGHTSEYLKTHLVPGDNHILGDGKVLIQDSPYGKLASVICYDADFPNYVRQAGKANADLMLIPSDDWEAITPLHARMASFRSIENGFSMIRPTFEGLSIAVDYHGNILSQMNDFTTEDVVMIADVPKQGIKTIYSQIGDLFAWLCVLGFLIMVGLSLTRSKGEKI
ncbi:MAG: apolipoprotein N-acyltransferase [Candidatus Methanocomedens sp.]|nr:MAG: apolipoprotein N-acyltransferase [ANME-2 cluster archaeon]